MISDRIITMAELLDRHPELRPTPEERRSPRLGSTSLGAALRRGAYVPPRAASVGQRAANILLWAARLYPGQYIEHGDLAAALLGTTRTVATPAVVKAITRAALAGAYRSLPKRGPHFVMSVRGLGVRCTADSADAKANYLPRLQKGTEDSLRRFLQYVEVIDPSELLSLDLYECRIGEAETLLVKVEERRGPMPGERGRVMSLKARLAEARRLRRSE